MIEDYEYKENMPQVTKSTGPAPVVYQEGEIMYGNQSFDYNELDVTAKISEYSTDFISKLMQINTSRLEFKMQKYKTHKSQTDTSRDLADQIRFMELQNITAEQRNDTLKLVEDTGWSDIMHLIMYEEEAPEWMETVQ